jgi:hypothetical protein
LVGISSADRDGESGSVSLSLEFPLIWLGFPFLGSLILVMLLAFLAGTLEGCLGFICQFCYTFARGSDEGSTIQLRVQLITVGSDCLAAMSA